MEEGKKKPKHHQVTRARALQHEEPLFHWLKRTDLTRRQNSLRFAL